VCHFCRCPSVPVRADADHLLIQFRAEAAREREELRADLRARAERAERDAGTYREDHPRAHRSSSRQRTGTTR